MLFTIIASSTIASSIPTIMSRLLTFIVIVILKHSDTFTSSFVKLLQLLVSLFEGTPSEHIIVQITKYIALQSNSTMSIKHIDEYYTIATTILELLCEFRANYFSVNNNNMLHDLTPFHENVGVTRGTQVIVTCKAPCICS